MRRGARIQSLVRTRSVGLRRVLLLRYPAESWAPRGRALESSVYPSVTLRCDHTGFNYLKIISLLTAQCTLVQSADAVFAIACRPSVRLWRWWSICDHIGWKPWKVIARGQLATFALCIQRAIHLLTGEHGEILGETIGGLGKKWHAGEQKRQYLWNA